MFKNSNIYIYILMLGQIFSEPEKNFSRQEMILSLSKELFIKNILIIQQPLHFTNTKTMPFVKMLSKSNIYTSFTSKQEIELLMTNYNSPGIVYSKSLILTFDEEFNNEVYELISGNEMVASKLLWLIWSTKNQDSKNLGVYVPYNIQLLIAENQIKENNNVFSISEIYQPGSVIFKRHFGTWSKKKGIEIPEKDLYKRRFNMNGTELKILYFTVRFFFHVKLSIL